MDARAKTAIRVLDMAFTISRLHSGKCFAQQGKALRNRCRRWLVAFHLKRHPPFETSIAKDLGNPRIVEVKRVPDASAVISLGLNDGGMGRELSDFRIWVA